MTQVDLFTVTGGKLLKLMIQVVWIFLMKYGRESVKAMVCFKIQLQNVSYSSSETPTEKKNVWLSASIYINDTLICRALRNVVLKHKDSFGKSEYQK